MPNAAPFELLNPGQGAHLADAQPIQVLPRKWRGRIALLLILLPLGLGLLAFGAIRGLEDPSDLLTVGGLLLTGLVVLAFGAWRWRAETKRRVTLYESGLELITASKRSTVRFQEVEQVWFVARRVQTGGLLGLAIMALVDRLRKHKSLDERGISIQVRVVSAESTLKLDSQDKGVFAAYQEITRRVNPRLIEEGRRRIESGDTLAFHKIALSKGGITFGKKTIPLAEIERVSIKGGQLSVKRRDKWFKSGQAVARIPNLYVLTELLTQLSGGSIAMEVPMGMNLASNTCI